MLMNEKKEIYCPYCNRRVATYDGKQSNYINVLCKTCYHKVIYKPDTDTIEIKSRPLRTTSSGCRKW